MAFGDVAPPGGTSCRWLPRLLWGTMLEPWSPRVPPCSPCQPLASCPNLGWGRTTRLPVCLPHGPSPPVSCLAGGHSGGAAPQPSPCGPAQMPPPGPHVLSLTRTHAHATCHPPPPGAPFHREGRPHVCHLRLSHPLGVPSSPQGLATKSHVPSPAQHTAPVPRPPCSTLGAFAHADPSAWSAVPCSCLWLVCLWVPRRLSMACSQVAALGCPELCWAPGRQNPGALPSEPSSPGWVLRRAKK